MRIWQGGLFLIAVAGLAALIAVMARPTLLEPPAKAEAVPTIPQDPHRTYLSIAQRKQAAATSPALGQVKSVLKVDSPLRYGQYVWNEQNVPAGPVWIRADLKQQTVSIFRGGHEIGVAIILYGADEMPTPVAALSILAKSEKHHSRRYNAPMPYSLWLTNDGVAIHGSNVRWGAATHGCLGVPIDFARRLFQAAKVGDRVDVTA